MTVEGPLDRLLLVHLDLRKLGRIPERRGHKIHGRATAKRGRGIGYDSLHSAVDDRSRVAFSRSWLTSRPAPPTLSAAVPSLVDCASTISGDHTPRSTALTPMAVLVNNVHGNHT
ncbi:MAG TPA: hypothetical protein VOA19_20380 [Actinomycetes bacterium]|nr:hypothetical protein [Actinomycetes bacterium]